MSEFTLHTLDTAPQGSRPFLQNFADFLLGRLSKTAGAGSRIGDQFQDSQQLHESHQRHAD